MDLLSIVSGLLPYVKISLFIFIILMTGYFMLKKFSKGKYSIRLSKFIFILLLICWGAIVLGLTTLSRPAMFTGEFNPTLFSSYVSTWNKWSVSEFQLIIFNMIMFVPLGVLLPLIDKKNKLFWRAFFLSIGFTLSIEIFQLVSGKGIFEFDDILHNTIGSVAGYFVVMAILLCLEQRKLKWAPIAKALTIPIFFIVLFATANAVYTAQEFGNLPFKPSQKQNMDQIHVELKTELSNKTSNACVYYNSDIKNLNNLKSVVQSVSQHFDLKQQGGVRMEGENRQLKLIDKKENIYYLTYFMSNGNWSFSTDNYSEETPKVDIELQKHSIETWLENEGLLPSNATYEQQDEKTIRWNLTEVMNLQSACEDFSQGFIVTTLSNQQVPDDFIYDVSDNKMVKEKLIISTKEAYEALVNGEFSLYNPLQKGDTLTITDVHLSYTYDTKGYYQPVYIFTSSVNDPEFTVEISIPAIQ